jgi:hypothetical protein
MFSISMKKVGINFYINISICSRIHSLGQSSYVLASVYRNKRQVFFVKIDRFTEWRLGRQTAFLIEKCFLHSVDDLHSWIYHSLQGDLKSWDSTWESRLVLRQLEANVVPYGSSNKSKLSGLPWSDSFLLTRWLAETVRFAQCRQMTTVELGAIGAWDNPSRRAYFLRQVNLSKCKAGGKQVKAFPFALLMTDDTLSYYMIMRHTHIRVPFQSFSQLNLQIHYDPSSFTGFHC